MKWLDYAFCKEGHMLFNFGVEGLTYKMVNGYPKYTELITDNPAGSGHDQAIGNYIQVELVGVAGHPLL